MPFLRTSTGAEETGIHKSAFSSFGRSGRVVPISRKRLFSKRHFPSRTDQYDLSFEDFSSRRHFPSKRHFPLRPDKYDFPKIALLNPRRMRRRRAGRLSLSDCPQSRLYRVHLPFRVASPFKECWEPKRNGRAAEKPQSSQEAELEPATTPM